MSNRKTWLFGFMFIEMVFLVVDSLILVILCERTYLEGEFPLQEYKYYLTRQFDMIPSLLG